MTPGRTSFDRYSREVLRLLGKSPAPTNLILLRKIDSTQRLCKKFVRDYLAEEEAVPAATLVAYEQLAGQGREGRAWQSPPGQGVYMTLVRSMENPELLSRCPLLVGVALVDAINQWTAGRCRLKWPNDLRVGGRKLGGILIDAITQPGEATVVFIGFGVNRGRRGSAAPAPGATSLALETEAPPTLACLAIALLSSLETLWPKLENPAWLLERYRSVSEHRWGEGLSYRKGAVRRIGIFRGFDDQGRLLFESEEAVEALSSGEIFSIPENSK